MPTQTMWRCRLRDSRGATNSVPVSPATQLRARVHPAIPTIRHQDPCKGVRHWSLLGFTTWECSICARILISIAVGTVIGCAFARPRPVERRPRGCFPRRRPHCLLSAPPRRPRYPCRWERSLRGHTATGMRTMSVLCLGACCYCICSLFSFLDGPMAWDASRSSAAIPTGVGFLGATEPRRPPHRPPHIHEARTARPRCVRGMTRRCDHLEGQELVFWKGGVFVDATRSSRRVLRGPPGSGAVSVSTPTSICYLPPRGRPCPLHRRSTASPPRSSSG